MLKKSVKERWVKALRSGRYRQGTGSLCTLRGDKRRNYCCLGVLAQLEGKLKPDQTGVDFGIPLGDDKFDYSGQEGGHLFFKSMRMTGGQLNTLVDMNDGRPGCPFFDEGAAVPPKSFKEIADWIEENL